MAAQGGKACQINSKQGYDIEEDLLFLYNEAKKSKGSIEFDDLVVDLEKTGAVVGLEIFNASKYLSELTNKKITKKDLKKIEHATFSFTTRNFWKKFHQKSGNT